MGRGILLWLLGVPIPDHFVTGHVLAHLNQGAAMEPVVSDPRFGVGVMDQPGTPAKSTASWSAILAGAFVAVAVSLVLFALGSGLGFASISPWSGQGLSMTTFAVTTAIWLIVMQWLSSAVGGYIAGRDLRFCAGMVPIRTQVFFRDTAHGFVTSGRWQPWWWRACPGILGPVRRSVAGRMSQPLLPQAPRRGPPEPRHPLMCTVWTGCFAPRMLPQRLPSAARTCGPK